MAIADMAASPRSPIPQSSQLDLELIVDARFFGLCHGELTPYRISCQRPTLPRLHFGNPGDTDSLNELVFQTTLPAGVADVGEGPLAKSIPPTL